MKVLSVTIDKGVYLYWQMKVLSVTIDKGVYLYWQHELLVIERLDVSYHSVSYS